MPDNFAQTLRDLAQAGPDLNNGPQAFMLAQRASNYGAVEIANKRVNDARRLVALILSRKATAATPKRLTHLADLIEGKRRRKAGRPATYDDAADERLLHNVAASGLSGPQYERARNLSPGAVKHARERRRSAERRAAKKPVKRR